MWGSHCSPIISLYGCRRRSQSLQPFSSNFGNTNLTVYAQWKGTLLRKLPCNRKGHLIISSSAYIWSIMFKLSPDKIQKFVRPRIESESKHKETPKGTIFSLKPPLKKGRVHSAERAKIVFDGRFGIMLILALVNSVECNLFCLFAEMCLY